VNHMPTFTPRYPPVGSTLVPLNTDWLQIEYAGANPGIIKYGTWWKLNKYAPAAERALIGDCYYYFLEAVNPPATNGTFTGQHVVSDAAGYSPTPAGQTTFDVYRHGKYPKLGVNEAYQAGGGKIAYNILYADMHCVTVTERSEAYRSIRQRYPG